MDDRTAPPRIGVRAPAPPPEDPPPAAPPPEADGQPAGREDSPLAWAEFLRWRRDWGPPEEWRAPIAFDALDEAIHSLASAAARLARSYGDDWRGLLAAGPEALELRRAWADRLGEAVAAAAAVAEDLTPGHLAARGPVREGWLPAADREAAARLAAAARDVKLQGGDPPGPARLAVAEWSATVTHALLALLAVGGDLSAAFRRLRWDRHDPSGEEIERLLALPPAAIRAAEYLGLLSGAGDLEDVLWIHMAAYERRHPEGWRPYGARRG